jgi:urease accessory protein
MDTGAPIVMRTARPHMTISSTLLLAQWLSPSYPLGSFAYSHGLETAISEGWVTDAETLCDWLTDILASGSGRSDVILLYAAHISDELATIDATGRAFATSAERLRESLHQGAAFARTTTAIWGDDLPELLFPVALGSAAARHNIPATLAASMYLHAFASNIIMACVRLVPLGQTEGQEVLNTLTPLCEKIAHDTADATLDDLASNTFMSDIAAMRHETLQPRLFQS